MPLRCVRLIPLRLQRIALMALGAMPLGVAGRRASHRPGLRSLRLGPADGRGVAKPCLGTHCTYRGNRGAIVDLEAHTPLTKGSASLTTLHLHVALAAAVLEHRVFAEVMVDALRLFFLCPEPSLGPCSAHALDAAGPRPQPKPCTSHSAAWVALGPVVAAGSPIAVVQPRSAPARPSGSREPSRARRSRTRSR